MTLEELKKMISKDETKNIELRFNPWVYGKDWKVSLKQCLGICLMLEFGSTCRTNIRGK